MMKKITVLALIMVSFVTSSYNNFYVPPPPLPPLPPNFHIAAFTSRNRKQGLVELRHSGNKAGVPFDVIFSDLSAKSIIASMLEYMDDKNFAPYEIVMFIDKNRSLFLADVNAILRKFLVMQKSFVISATKLKPRGYTEEELYESLLIKEDAHFYWPSSAGFIGRVDTTTKILKRLLVQAKQNPHVKLGSLFSKDFFAHMTEYKLDTNANIFLSVAYLGFRDLLFRDREPLVSVHLKKDIFYPKIIHSEQAHGGNDKLVRNIYLSLFSFDT